MPAVEGFDGKRLNMKIARPNDLINKGKLPIEVRSELSRSELSRSELGRLGYAASAVFGESLGCRPNGLRPNGVGRSEA